MLRTVHHVLQDGAVQPPVAGGHRHSRSLHIVVLVWKGRVQVATIGCGNHLTTRGIPAGGESPLGMPGK